MNKKLTQPRASISRISILLMLVSVFLLMPLTAYADENLKNIAIKYKDATSFYLLAQKYAIRGGSYEDFEEAIKWYKEAAKLGHIKSKLKLGTLYYEGLGTKTDLDTAANWLMEPATNGYTDAQYMLGMIYLQGTAKIKKNESKALTLLEKAAEEFNTDAIFQVGRMYYYGVGAQKNIDKAKKYLTLADEQNNALAGELLNNIAQQKVEPAPENIAIATKKTPGEILLESAQKGNTYAQYQVASAYLGGNLGLEKNKNEALKWLNKSANSNQKEAQYLLGSIYYNGTAVKRDLKKAKMWLNKAAKSGVENARVLISAINDQTRTKTAKQKSNTSTNDLFVASANRGDKEAQFKVGMMYLNGADGFPKDQQKALHWLREAADQGHTKAEFEIGMMYYKPGDQDNQTAQSLLLKAADKGHANAQYFLAAIYNQNQQYDDAAKWLDMAFQNNHEEALEMLVELYMAGKLGNPDSKRVFKWLEQASVKGLRDAQYKLGEEYLGHAEITNNKRKAFAWIEKSARNGFTQAKYKLATLYQKGIGARKQYTKSARWFRDAAEDGHKDAQYDLAELYLKGLGLPRSKTKAKQWLEKAADQGHLKAKIKLGSLTRF